MTDHYKILGVRFSSTKEEIKSAYREKAKKFHPDKNLNNPFAEVFMKAINEAYDILSDVTKRAKYDQELLQFQRTQQYNRATSSSQSTPYTMKKTSQEIWIDIGIELLKLLFRKR